jgi:hypothetical protein
LHTDADESERSLGIKFQQAKPLSKPFEFSKPFPENLSQYFCHFHSWQNGAVCSRLAAGLLKHWQFLAVFELGLAVMKCLNTTMPRKEVHIA